MFFLSSAYDLVVNIGKISHINDIIAEKQKVAVYHIKDHSTSSVTNMAIVVYCYSTDVHFDLVWFKRLKFFLGLG
jgi:hypothetical protein